MKTVEAVAMGYEWLCLECEELNQEIEAVDTCTCQACGAVFEMHTNDAE